MLKDKFLKNQNIILIAMLFILSLITYAWAFRHPLKWDMIDYFLPNRYFLSECLHNFSLPLWNPFQSMGIPSHSDPQAGMWYPVAWIFSIFGYYGFYHLSAEFIFHIFIGSVGIFYLSKFLFNEHRVAFFTGLAYLSCGFFISNAQHLSWIVSGAWVPFVFLFYLKFLKSQKIMDALCVSFFLFLLFTGGYTAFIIVVFYLLGLMGLYKLIALIIIKDTKKTYQFIGINMLMIVIFCLFSAVSLISILEALPLINRGDGLSLQKALENPFSFPSFTSFVLPYASVKSFDFFKTDQSMANAYFGIIPLFFVIYGLFLKPPKWIIGLLMFSFLMLALAVGDALPFREWTYNYIPLMNLFRFPSLFRLFAIISLLIISAWSFKTFLSHKLNPKKSFWIILILFIVGFLSVIFISRWNNFIGLKLFILNNPFRFSNESTFVQHLVFQSITQLIVVIAFGIIVFCKKIKHKVILIFLIITFDMLSATWLNTPYSVVSDNFKTSEVENKLNTFKHVYPIPQRITIYNDEKENYYGPLWQNLSTYSKNIPDDSYNPFTLKTHTALLQSLNRNEIELYIPQFMFFPKTFLPISENSVIYGTDTAYIDFAKIKSNKHQDTLSNIKIASFKPGKLEFETSTNSEQILVIAQNYYPNWDAKTEDGSKLKLLTINYNMIGIIIPKGNHKITLEYHPVKVIFMLWVSICSLLIFAIYILTKNIQNKNVRN